MNFYLISGFDALIIRLLHRIIALFWCSPVRFAIFLPFAPVLMTLFLVKIYHHIYDFCCCTLDQHCPHFCTLSANYGQFLRLHIVVLLLHFGTICQILSPLLPFAWLLVIFFLSYKNAPYIAFSVLFHCSLYREHIRNTAGGFFVSVQDGISVISTAAIVLIRKGIPDIIGMQMGLDILRRDFMHFISNASR